MSARVPNVSLNNGVEMPQLGFGTWPLEPDAARVAISLALDTGYRSLDTAAFYGTEVSVGEAVRRAGLEREDVFVTSKVWNSDQGYERTLRAFDASLQQLGFQILDLYLIHWPQPDNDLYSDTWRAMQTLLAEGRVRAIGVSNFQRTHLERLIQDHAVVPAVNQVELHPQFSQHELREFHRAYGIKTGAWAPLAKGGAVLAEPTITNIARKFSKTPAQIILRWHMQLGNVTTPKSATPSRIRENFAIFDFELDASDLDEIALLDSGHRIGADPSITTA
jgi:2,5-diketo-D-gluconate reductase A